MSQVQTSTTFASAQPSPAQQQAVQQNLKDIHFDFDRYDLTDQDRQTLQENADWLKANPGVTVSIAGNADERGEIVYNLVLSQKRADVTRDALIRDALISLGIPGDRIEFATGWGKLYPVCEQSDESCWSQNRRAHLTPGTMLQTETVAQELKSLPIIAWAALDCR
jgi:peptidoglycan-associated lipoprotein